LERKNVTIGENLILKELSFKISKGFTTIVGVSGSGKSTFLKALCNIIKFDNGGRILLNGNEVENFENLVSFVPQSVKVIKGSILDNITMNFDGSYDLNRIYQAIQLSKFSCQGIRELNLEKLNETMLNDNSLSGGERQRLGIARALYSDRPIICLDEISSALDSSTEKDLFDSLRALSSNRIVLSIAHRYSILNEDDNVILFEEGTVYDYGTMGSLIIKSNSFKSLYDKYFNLN
jgi:ABC-type bacteriocin/lantibiotic exporter with double-glycine peptidase domain